MVLDSKKNRSGLHSISEDRPLASDHRPIRRNPHDPCDYNINPEIELGIVEEFEDASANNALLLKRDRIMDCVDPLDSCTMNSGQNKVCVGGARGVMKVFNVVGNQFELCHDFRKISGKRLNLLYSPSNVCWSKIDDDLIASTSTNGAVVFWNMEKLKLDHHFKSHARSATAITLHPTDANICISGSKNSEVLVYDIRDGPTAKLVSGGFDAIRDLQFSPHQEHGNFFVSCDDAGIVRMWDLRRTDKALLIFPAHHGYVSSVQFSPISKFLLATGGGRDKLIKIWDWSKSYENGPLYSMETMAPVGRVYWRPNANCSTQLATCSVVNDTSVHIWDIRRPYMPYASFSEHRDSVTCMSFFSDTDERFVSVGKDGLLILHDFTRAQFPVNLANDISIDTAPDGLVGIAVNSLAREKRPFVQKQGSEKLYSSPKRASSTAVPPCNSIQPQSILKTSLARTTSCSGVKMSSTATATRAPEVVRPSSTYDPFRGPTQSIVRCGQPEHAAKHLTQRCFIELALEYRLGGAPPAQLAGFNSDVASRHGLHDVARTWRLMTGLLLHELRDIGYPEEWRLNEMRKRTTRIEQLAIQMREEGDYMARTVYSNNSGPRLAVEANDIVADFTLDKYEPGFRDDVLRRKKRRGKPSHERTKSKNRKHKGQQRKVGGSMRKFADVNSLESSTDSDSSSNISIRTTDSEEGTSTVEEDPELGENQNRRTSKLAHWYMRKRIKPNTKPINEKVRRTDAPSPVHDPRDDDGELYGNFGEYHYGLQPTDVRRKTNEDLAWQGSTRTAHTWRPLADEAFEVQNDMHRWKKKKVKNDDDEGKKKKRKSEGYEGGENREDDNDSEDDDEDDTENEEEGSGDDEEEASPIVPIISKTTDDDDDEFCDEETEAERDRETAVASVEQILRKHADRNDVQTCAVLCIVFGKIMIDILGEPLIVAWISAYESMLDRVRLMTAVAELRKNCVLPSIAEKSLSGTYIKLGCRRCRKLVSKGACERCKLPVAATLCSICRRPLTGLAWSCEGCGHASHSRHARDWFDRFPQCAVRGCDCECAFWQPQPGTLPLLLRPKDLKTRPAKIPQRSMTVENFMYCDQLLSLEILEDYHAQRHKRERQRHSEKRTRELLNQRWEIIRKLKRNKIPIDSSLKRIPADLNDSCDEDETPDQKPPPEAEVVVEDAYETRRRLRVSASRPETHEERTNRLIREEKDVFGAFAPLHVLHEVDEDNLASSHERSTVDVEVMVPNGLESTVTAKGSTVAEEEEELVASSRSSSRCDDEEIKDQGDEDEEINGEMERKGVDERIEEDRVELECSCGTCVDCALFAGYQSMNDEQEIEAGKRRATSARGWRFRPHKDAVRDASTEALCSHYLNTLWRALARSWGMRPRWKRRFRRFRPFVRRCTAARTRGQSRRARMRIRPGLGAGKEPRVPEQHRTKYVEFTLERFASILEWQAIDWQRKLGCKRLVPRSFYKHPLFGLSDSELKELPMRTLQEHLRDVNGVLRRLFAKTIRCPDPGRSRAVSSGWRRRGRGNTGVAYRSVPGKGGQKEKRKMSLEEACLVRRRRGLKWDPVGVDYRTTLEQGPKERRRKEYFYSAFSPRLDGDHWRRETMKRRHRIFHERRYAHILRRDNIESTRKRYAKWHRMVDQVFKYGQVKIDLSCKLTREMSVSPECDARRAAEAAKRAADAARAADVERLLNESTLVEDFKALGINDARLPHLRERKPDSIRVDIRSWDEKRKDKQRFFSLDDMFDDEDNQRVARMQAEMDEWSKIEAANRVVDERKKRQREKKEKEHEYEYAKRLFWSRYKEKKMRGEQVRAPLCANSDGRGNRARDKAELERKNADKRAKHMRMMEVKTLARSVGHLLDIHSIRTD